MPSEDAQANITAKNNKDDWDNIDTNPRFSTQYEPASISKRFWSVLQKTHEHKSEQ
jgi:hypothetical protein